MTLVHICDQCSFGQGGTRCVVCGAHGELMTQRVLWLWVVRNDFRACSIYTSARRIARKLTAAVSDAYYCVECTRLEKDRDGCPRIVNVSVQLRSVTCTADKQLGASRVDAFYERKKLATQGGGFKQG